MRLAPFNTFATSRRTSSAGRPEAASRYRAMGRAGGEVIATVWIRSAGPQEKSGSDDIFPLLQIQRQVKIGFLQAGFCRSGRGAFLSPAQAGPECARIQHAARKRISRMHTRKLRTEQFGSQSGSTEPEQS